MCPQNATITVTPPKPQKRAKDGEGDPGGWTRAPFSVRRPLSISILFFLKRA
jgi:hypothetical protein